MKGPSFQLKKMIWLTAFCIAMGYLETSVVVYLRVIYYPDGFGFPLAPIDRSIATVEVWREVATLVMLLGAGYIVGKSFIQRFAFFIYSFAIWDIFYYIFLKILLDWPASFMTWDILFLLPVTWVGPVITPVIVSLSMILLAVVLLRKDNNTVNFKLKLFDWCLLILGSLVIITSFIWDYTSFVLQYHNWHELWSLGKEDLFIISESYVPDNFNWPIFILGEGLCLITIIKIFKKS